MTAVCRPNASYIFHWFSYQNGFGINVLVLQNRSTYDYFLSIILVQLSTAPWPHNYLRFDSNDSNFAITRTDLNICQLQLKAYAETRSLRWLFGTALGVAFNRDDDEGFLPSLILTPTAHHTQ